MDMLSGGWSASTAAILLLHTCADFVRNIFAYILTRVVRAQARGVNRFGAPRQAVQRLSRCALGRSWAICLCARAFMRSLAIRTGYIQYGGSAVQYKKD